MTTLGIRCACGQVTGQLRDVSTVTANSATCYCRDCQAFATFLGRDDVMDAAGGTAIVATFPAHYTITSGAEHLRAVRLSDKGLVRWYADCCRTPMGNHMAWAKPPFVGVPFRAVAGAPVVVEGIMGYAPVPINGRSARQPVQETFSGTMGAIGRALGVVWRVWRAGANTVPFPRDDVSRVRVLTPDERAALGR